MKRLERDDFDHNIAYLAKWQDAIGASSFCLFSRLEPAIFFVVSGLLSDIDWSTFPDHSKKYPYDERNGVGKFTPVFRVDRIVKGHHVMGEVHAMSIADCWTVGNGIAKASKKVFLQATGQDLIELSGTGDRLQGRVGPGGRLERARKAHA